MKTQTIRTPVMMLAGGLLLLQSGCGSESEPTVEPPGEEESARTRVLETGSLALQTDAPLDPMNVYVVGFHPMKEDPAHQMEAHHFCKQVNEDLAQCALFDGNTSDANLNGIEYIISERLFESLPEDEKQYWHPHNYEILSGQLVAPGLPDVAEKELMETKMNSYGKTWHVWDTGTAEQEGDALPLGDPRLGWSFNRDGEASPEMLQARDDRLEIDTREKREDRQDLVRLANPQEGVDTLKDRFPGPTEAIAGVEAKAQGDQPDGNDQPEDQPSEDDGP